jgi:uncharacterized membrane protein
MLTISSNVPILNIHVSKQHFQVYSIIYEIGKEDEFPPKVYVLDLESSNGTYVNNQLIGIVGKERKGRILNDGDVIGIRPFWSFRFRQKMPQVEAWDRQEEEDFEVIICTHRPEPMLTDSKVLSRSLHRHRTYSRRRHPCCSISGGRCFGDEADGMQNYYNPYYIA